MSGNKMDFTPIEGDMTNFFAMLNDDSWMNDFTTLDSHCGDEVPFSTAENIDPALLASQNEQSRSPPKDRSSVLQNGAGEIVNEKLVLDPQLRNQEQCGVSMQDRGMLQESFARVSNDSPGSQAPVFDLGAQGQIPVSSSTPNVAQGYAPQAQMTMNNQHHGPADQELPWGNFPIAFNPYPPRYQNQPSAQANLPSPNSLSGNAGHGKSPTPDLYRHTVETSIEDQTQRADLSRSDLANTEASARPGGVRSDLQNGSVDLRFGQGQQIESLEYDNIPDGIRHQPEGNQMAGNLFLAGGMDETLYNPQSFNTDIWSMDVDNTFTTPLPTNLPDPSTSFSPTPTIHQSTPALLSTRPTNFRPPTSSFDSKEKGTCVHINEKTGRPCGKNFFLSKSDCTNRCQRCCNKFLRKTASGPFFTLSPSIPTLVEARNLIHPPMQRTDEYVALGQEEAQRAKGREDEYIQKFLDAINDSQTSQANPWLAKQQATFSGNCALKPSYSPAMITARLRALFAELILFHSPNDPSLSHFYAIGGDNTGYAIKYDLGFEDRMKVLCRELALNKRIVMDVVEGRGVQGFVGHPEDFARRKRSNMDCNEKKNGIYERGKRVKDGEERGRGRGKRKGFGDELGSGDEESGVEDGDEDGDAPASPPSKRTRRATGKQTQNDDGDDEDFQSSTPFPENQVYGSGRANTVGWINGRSRRRRS